ncbi:starvation-inducible DNA-binding protein [Flavobacterium flevense]|uniref:DNA starvation/stationary phase protection protein n=1 Tax=Flavobacterium flevense TaxID=983 RepID=A0A4Y4B235_9FLAO|nr:DNA starvation/stationary phase protection protein [Flavobacterium flevense]GEC73177.1 DNA starvation/stationary phase protection protein [Flavobacterium flevense]SHL47761.1 starvation-inducible DNA-binding protein [Flavobacterium flevense]
MEPKIGITKKDLNTSVDFLTVVLANEMLLYVKTRKFHWNVSGNSFMELHKLFEEHYTELEHTIDEIAERISKLGAKAIGTMQEFIDHATLKENSNNTVDQKEMINELLSDHEAILKQLREYIKEVEETNDYGTADFLTALLQSHETQAWTVRKYVNK